MLLPRIKSAEPQPVGLSPIEAGLSDRTKADALRRVVQWGLLSAGAGAGVGLLRELPRTLSPAVPPVDRMELTTGDVTIQAPDDEEEKKRKRRRTKVAKEEDPFRAVIKRLMPTTPGKPLPNMFSREWLQGDGQTNSFSVPWAIPAAVTAVAAGGVGGHALVKWLANKRLEKDRDADLSDAEREYEDALSGVRKGASLDDAWGGLQKLAATTGMLSGGAMTLAGLLSLLAGYGSYSLTRKADPAKGMAAALDERARMRAMHSPPPIRMSLADDDDEDDKPTKMLT